MYDEYGNIKCKIPSVIYELAFPRKIRMNELQQKERRNSRFPIFINQWDELEVLEKLIGNDNCSR